ncbi:long-chain-fatty-acid--CoA ligase, partial [Mycobacterium marinum]
RPASSPRRSSARRAANVSQRH